jgi:uncharacterized membrane protein
MRQPKRIAVTVALAAIQFALSATRTGSLPLPTGLNVSVFAVPATLAGVLAGPLSAALVGAVFGAMTLALATTPLFQNPIVALVPRIVFGPIAALTYLALRRTSEPLALVTAGAIGPAVNTGLVLILAAVLTSPVGAPYIAPDAAWDVARTSIPAEAILGAAVTLAVGLAARAAKLAQP